MSENINFVNLTPHAINVQLESGEIVTFAPSGVVARIGVKQNDCGTIGGFQVKTNVYGKVEGLPEPKVNTFYIVSNMVLEACNTHRMDLLAPDTSNPIRNDKGQIIAVTGFVC